MFHTDRQWIATLLTGLVLVVKLALVVVRAALLWSQPLAHLAALARLTTYLICLVVHTGHRVAILLMGLKLVV